MQSPRVGASEEITETLFLTYEMDESISRVPFSSEIMHLFKILPAEGGRHYSKPQSCSWGSPGFSPESHAFFSLGPASLSPARVYVMWLLFCSSPPPPLSWGLTYLIALTVSLSGVFPPGNSPCRTRVCFCVCEGTCIQLHWEVELKCLCPGN